MRGETVVSPLIRRAARCRRYITTFALFTLTAGTRAPSSTG